MVAQTFDIIFSLFFYPLQESRIAGISSTGKHKILPNKNTIFICQIIETIILISSSPPYTYHIHIGLFHVPEQGLITLSGYTGKQCIIRDIIGSFGKHRDTIHFKIKRFSLFIFFVYHPYRTKSDAMLARGNCFTVTYHLC